MEDYHKETRECLASSVSHSGLSRYGWAAMQGISTGTVYDILNARPVSIKRLNTIRPLLGLALIEIETIKIDPARQKVVNRQGPTPYTTRQVRLTPKDAELLDDLLLRKWGYRSFSQWFHSELLGDLLNEHRNGSGYLLERTLRRADAAENA